MPVPPLDATHGDVVQRYRYVSSSLARHAVLIAREVTVFK
jgi:hypothetical protein